MISLPMRQSRLIAIVSAIVIMTSCGRSCGRRPPVQDGIAPDDREAVFIQQPVSFCWQRPIEPKRGRVQVLVDSSGSMVGFQNVTPHLVNWVQQGISQLQGGTLTIDSSRICQFSQSYGIANCASLGQPGIKYDHSGNTNLHEAIRSAKDYELTFILTDGVAFTGNRGQSGCAGGVDAACVAKALQEFVHAQTAQNEDVDRGFWLVPIVATYDGKFYTDEPIVPENFQTSETINQIKSDIGVETVVQAPRNEANSLVFTYRGPRAMLLMVLARWTDVGRSAVQALWERSSLNGVQRLEQIRGFSSGLAALSPIEVYPGFLNAVQWKALKESDEASEMRGTIDAFFDKGAISLSCPKNGGGQGVYRLTGDLATAGKISGCVAIRLLPAFNFKFRTVRQEDDSEMARVLEGFERRNGDYADLQLHLACTMEAPRFCGENQISTQWIANMNYAKAADGLAASQAEHFVQQQVRGMSTDHPSREPHRIFAFLETLEAFYREVAQDQRSLILANLQFCHKK